MTGLGSLIEAKSKPFAWIGSLGITTLSPGVWLKYASGDWEWYKAPCPTAPQVDLNVNFPHSNWPPDLYLYFAASFTIWSNAGKI